MHVQILTKKRRLKRNRKYLVTATHPFPMAVFLETKENLLAINVRELYHSKAWARH